MAEQLAFRYVIRQCGAIERQERLLATRAAQMAGPGQNIFAGAGIAHNQQWRIQHRQLARLIQHLAHFRTGGNDMIKLGIVVHRQIL
ncbi:hypothetical protein D3C75_952710 [compost metagenome]